MQTIPPTAANPTDDRRLTLDVVVSDRSGKAVPGLQAQDFVVLDNKKPQKLISFEETGGAVQTEPPVEILLVVDEVNTSFTNVTYVRDQIRKFLLKNGGQLAHPVTLAFFSDAGTQIQDGSSRDGKGLLASFDQHETALRTIRRSAGFYGAEERFQLSLGMLNTLTKRETQIPGRKMVIWVSPGWPLLSGPNIQLSNKDVQGLFHSIVSASTAMRNARMTLYSIDPLGVEDSGRGFYYEEFLKPVLAPKNAQPANLSLQVLAMQTGGLALRGSTDITSQIQRAVADADAFYTLTVEMPPAEANEYHGIEVKVDPPGLTARTRRGYYGQP
ncbi:MAG TPA: VWA domain-containing protein [Edaphobacter sp.]